MDHQMFLMTEEIISNILKTHGPIKAIQICRILKEEYGDINKREVNSILYSMQANGLAYKNEKYEWYIEDTSTGILKRVSSIFSGFKQRISLLPKKNQLNKNKASFDVTEKIDRSKASLNKDKVKKQKDDINIQMLKLMFKNNPSPEKIINYWPLWTKRIASSRLREERVAKIALSYDINWIGDEKLSNFIGFNIDHICQLPNYSFRKKKILIFCVAKAASRLKGDEKNKKSREGVSTNIVSNLLKESKIPLHYSDIEDKLIKIGVKGISIKDIIEKDRSINEIIFEMFIHTDNQTTKIETELLEQEEYIWDKTNRLLKNHNGEYFVPTLVRDLLNSKNLKLFTKNALYNYIISYLGKDETFSIKTWEFTNEFYLTLNPHKQFNTQRRKELTKDKIKVNSKTKAVSNSQTIKLIPEHDLIKEKCSEIHKKYLVNLNKEIKSWLISPEGRNHKYGSYLSQTPAIFELLLKLMNIKSFSAEIKMEIEKTIEYFLNQFDNLPEVLIGPPGYLDDLIVAMMVLKLLLDNQCENIVKECWDGELEILPLIHEILFSAEEMVGATIYHKIKAEIYEKQ